MSFHRATILILAALVAAGFTSAASACCGWGTEAPIAYSPVGYGGYTGCGGCGTPTAAAVYAQPVAPAPPPWAVSTWTGGCGCACGCRGFISAAIPAVEPYPIAPAPIYVVNQGPDYTGPGIMVPYHTWTPAESYVTPGAYPYAYGYGYRYRHRYGYGFGYRYGNRYGYGLHRTFFAPRSRFAYRERFYGHPFYHRPMPTWGPAMHRYYR